MKIWLRRFAAFLLAVVVTGVCASVLSTQFVIAALQAIHVPFDFVTRAQMTFADLAILRSLVPVFLLTLLPAFLMAGLLAQRVGGSREAWFVAAGAAAIVAVLLLIGTTLGLMPIAGARSTAGLLAQGIAGAAGGWIFAIVTRQSREAAA